MNHTCFFRIFPMGLVLCMSILTANTCKAEPATYEKNGSIHIGNMTLIMSPNGQIFITNPDGDRYDVHLSLVSNKTKKKWFTTHTMKDKKIQVNADTQKTVFTANLTEKQSESPVGVEYTLGINDRKKVEIRLRYLTEGPIENILSLANLHIHAPRKQMAGSQIQIDKKTLQFDTRDPQELPSVGMYDGQAKRVGCFANQPERALVLRPIKTKTFILNDYNVSARDPYVEWRFVPVDNEIVFEVDTPAPAPGSATGSATPAEQVQKKTQKKR